MDLFSNPPEERVYVLAQNYRHAKYWADRQGLSPKQWVYIDESYRLRGNRDVLVYEYSTFWNHPHAWSIRKTLDQIGYREYRPKSLES